MSLFGKRCHFHQTSSCHRNLPAKSVLTGKRFFHGLAKADHLGLNSYPFFLGSFVACRAIGLAEAGPFAVRAVRAGSSRVPSHQKLPSPNQSPPPYPLTSQSRPED